jgi:hypothetical protein
MTPTPCSAAGALFLALAPAFAQVGMNEHTLYNTQKTSFATRGTTTGTDTIYFSQLLTFHNNVGQGTGWRIVVQDQDQSTSESVTLSWHDTLPSGIPVTTPIASHPFVLFGTGSGVAAYIFTLTTPLPVVLPQQVALGIELPAPHPWASDAATLHYQRGDKTIVKPELRRQMTYVLSGGNAVAEWTIGSTFRWGGLYQAPALATANLSTGYGVGPELLYGPEALAIDPVRGDRLGWAMRGDRFKTFPTQPVSAGALYCSVAYRTPLPTPFGVLVIDETTAVWVAAAITDAQGQVLIPAIAVPNAPFDVVFQAAFINLQTLEVALTNGCRIRV